MPVSPVDKLSLMVFSGDFERVYYALLLASAAVAANIPVTLFFTMGACLALRQPRAGGIIPGWADMPERAIACEQRFAAQGIATFEDLLAAAVTLGVRFIVCETGLKAVGLTQADLRPDVPVEIAGVVTFLADSSRAGGMMFI